MQTKEEIAYDVSVTAKIYAAIVFVFHIVATLGTLCVVTNNGKSDNPIVFVLVILILAFAFLAGYISYKIGADIIAAAIYAGEFFKRKISESDK